MTLLKHIPEFAPALGKPERTLLAWAVVYIVIAIGLIAAGSWLGGKAVAVSGLIGFIFLGTAAMDFWAVLSHPAAPSVPAHRSRLDP